MWRPKNWVNPFKEMIRVEEKVWYKESDYEGGGWYGHPDLIEHYSKSAEEYEAGADAMLDSLFEMAKESPTRTFTIDSNKVIILGG